MSCKIGATWQSLVFQEERWSVQKGIQKVNLNINKKIILVTSINTYIEIQVIKNKILLLKRCSGENGFETFTYLLSCTVVSNLITCFFPIGV